MSVGSTCILVFRSGAVGDFILTTPVFQALREYRPGDQVTLYCHPRMAALALAGGLADKLESIDSLEVSKLFVRDGEQGEEFKKVTKPCDVAISFLHDPGGFVQANLIRAGAKRVVCGSPLVGNGHAADWMMKPLAELGIPVTTPAIPFVRLPEEHVERGRERLLALETVRQPARRQSVASATDDDRTRTGCSHGALSPFPPCEARTSFTNFPSLPRKAAGDADRNVVAIHPGSGSAKKNWPARRFGTLARRLRDECGFVPVFIFGEADSDVKSALAGVLQEFSDLPGCDLLDLASVLSVCRGYVGNDSGITHLAAALGIPAVALFGPTDPAVWGPRGSNVRIVRAPGFPASRMADIDPGLVLDCASEAFLACESRVNLLPYGPVSPARD